MHVEISSIVFSRYADQQWLLCVHGFIRDNAGCTCKFDWFSLGFYTCMSLDFYANLHFKFYHYKIGRLDVSLPDCLKILVMLNMTVFQCSRLSSYITISVCMIKLASDKCKRYNYKIRFQIIYINICWITYLWFIYTKCLSNLKIT